MDAEQQTVPGQKEGGQSSRRSPRRGPLSCESKRDRRGGLLQPGPGLRPTMSCLRHRATGESPQADKAGGAGSGQSLPHTRSLRCGNDPTQKLQGQQPYMAARRQALLNKDKEENPAFPPVPRPWLRFQQPCSRRGSRVPLDLLWLVGSPSHPPHETHPACPGERRQPQSTAGHRGQAGARSAPGSLSFSGTRQPVFIRKWLAASHPPEIRDHHPSSARFHRPFSPE